MPTVKTTGPRIPLRSRLSAQLALLFVGTFLLTLILLMAWTMLATIADRGQAAENSQVATPVIVIDPKIQSDLAKALAFDALPTSGEVLNPFLDRAGLSGVAASSTTGIRPQGQAIASGRSTASGGSPTASTNSGQMNFSQVPPAAVIETYSVKSRHDDWLQRQSRGEFVGPESEILIVEDLVPVGYASGGDREAEVMLYSVSLCRTFSFPTGTRFANGWLAGFDQREVMFSFQNGVRRKSYSDSEVCQTSDSGLAN